MTIRAVITALDGVLVDIAGLDDEIFQYVIRRVIGKNISLTEQRRDLGNLSFNSKISLLNMRGIIKWADLEIIQALYHERIFHIFNERIKPNNDIISVGEFIRHSGKCFVCVTNKDYQVALFALDCCGVLPYIQYIVTPDQVPMGKPAGYGYTRALEYCQSQPENTLVLESDQLGVEAASRAGCRAYHVSRKQNLNVSFISSLMDIQNG